MHTKISGRGMKLDKQRIRREITAGDRIEKFTPSLQLTVSERL
jgi:hypothetical protein